MTMLSRTHLEIIRLVQRTGSLSSAAAQLHLTQSALSHSINKLEAALGTSVWLREGRKLRLTQAGELLLATAERVLPEFEHCEKLITDLAKGNRGILRIGMECHPCYIWLQNVISPFLERFTGVDVDIKQQFQFDGLSALCSYDLDLLITPDPNDRPRIQFIPVFDYELVLVLPSRHPLADRQYVVPKDLKDQTLITYPVPEKRLDIFVYFLDPAFSKPAAHKTLESTEIMLQMVAAGRGITALPRWLVEEYAARWPLVSKPLGKRGVFKKIYLGIHESNLEVPYIEQFIDIALAYAPDQRSPMP